MKCLTNKYLYLTKSLLMESLTKTFVNVQCLTNVFVNEKLHISDTGMTGSSVSCDTKKGATRNGNNLCNKKPSVLLNPSEKSDVRNPHFLIFVCQLVLLVFVVFNTKGYQQKIFLKIISKHI